MQNPARFKEFIAAAALTAGLVAVGPSWADDAPVKKAAGIEGTGPEKTRTITSEERDRKLGEQSKEIETLVREEHQKTQAAINALDAKHTHDWIDNFFTALSVAASIAAFAAMWQARKYNKEQGEVVNEQRIVLNRLTDSTKKVEAIINELSIFADKTADHIRRAEKLAYRAQGNTELGAAIIHVNRTVRVLERRDARKERLGSFPYLFPYLSSRIQSAREQVIVKMPMYLFGAVGSPHGMKEFHHALYEQFSGAAANEMQLVVMLYDDARRAALARSRYSRAVDALRLLNDRPLTASLLEIFNDETAKTLGREIENYRSDLSSKDRRQLYELAEDQILWEDTHEYEQKFSQARARAGQKNAGLSDEEIGDVLYYENLRDKQERALFARVLRLRRTFGDVLAAQEMTYYRENESWAGQGTPWPDSATVIRLNIGEFDNEITVCIDGKEIIRCFSNLTDLDSRDNRVVSELGHKNLLKYKSEMLGAFKKNNVLEPNGDVIKNLSLAISKAARKTKVEDILYETRKIRRKLDEPKPEV